MSIPSGNGGSLFFQDTYPGSPTDDPLDPAEFHTASNVEVGISKWSGNWNPRLQEITRSFNTNGTRYKKVVLDPAVTVELPLDDAATLEGIGLDSGDLIPLTLLKVGSSSLYYMILSSTVDVIEPVCDNNNDVVRYRMSMKGGDKYGPDTLANLGLTIP